MKTKLFFIVAFVLGTTAIFAQEYWINENFTSIEWQNVMRNYVDSWNADPEHTSNQKTFPPASGNAADNGNFAINDAVTSPNGISFNCSNCQYFHFSNTSVQDGVSTLGNLLPSIEGDITSQYLLRLNNPNNGNASLELPLLENIGKITIHTRNRNINTSTNIILEKYDEKSGTWKAVETQVILPYGNIDGEGNTMTTIDTVIIFDFYSEVPVKLRFAKDIAENRFIHFFKLKIEKYDAGNYWINDNFTSIAWQNVMNNYAVKNSKSFPVGPGNGNFMISDDIITSPGGRDFRFFNCQYFYYSTSEERDGYAPTGGSLLPSIDGDITAPYLLRTNNTANGDAYIELPQLDNIGKIILYARNRNTTDASNILLQKYNESNETWETIETKTIAPYANIDGEGNAMTTIDMVVTYSFSSSLPVKLRINKDYSETRHISFYKIKIEKYDAGDGTFMRETNRSETIVSVSGKTISIHGNAIYPSLGLYDLAGKEVFCIENAGRQIQLPAFIGNGIYVLKLSGGKEPSVIKKVFLR